LWFLLAGSVLLPSGGGGEEKKASSNEETDGAAGHPARVKVVRYADIVNEATAANNTSHHLFEVVGDARRPLAYFDLIRRRGGVLVLTRGTTFTPIGQLNVRNGRLIKEELPDGFRLPASVARDVSLEVAALYGGRLPGKAGRALLFWPDDMQTILQEKLSGNPWKEAARFRARYEVKGETLIVTLTSVLTGGGWKQAGNFRIKL